MEKLRYVGIIGRKMSSNAGKGRRKTSRGGYSLSIDIGEKVSVGYP